MYNSYEFKQQFKSKILPSLKQGRQRQQKAAII